MRFLCVFVFAVKCRVSELGGPMVTAGDLLFIGASAHTRVRAFEPKTGRELWTAELDYNVTAVPMTYMGRNGKQFVAVTAASGRDVNTESLDSHSRDCTGGLCNPRPFCCPSLPVRVN